MTKTQIEDMRRQNPNLIEITHPGQYGVYKLTINGKSYVGQSDKTLEDRYKKGYPWKEDMIKAIESAPNGTIEMKWLHENLGSIKQADFWEKLEIAKQGTLYPYGYNNTTGGHSDFIVVNDKTVPIVQLSKETGELIAKWPSQAVAGRKTKVNPNHICDCLAGRAESAGGYRWKTLAEWQALQNAENTTPM